MHFHSYVPRPPRGEFVEDFWHYDGYSGDHLRETILPSGTFEMVFNLAEDELRIYSLSTPDRCRRFTGALVSGPYAGSFLSDSAEEAAIMGVHFKPGGAFPFLGLPARDLTNMHVDLRALWGPAAGDLHDRVRSASSTTERFMMVEQALLARLRKAPIRHGAVGRALDLLTLTHGRARVRDIAQAVDLSQRRLIE